VVSSSTSQAPTTRTLLHHRNHSETYNLDTKLNSIWILFNMMAQNAEESARFNEKCLSCGVEGFNIDCQTCGYFYTQKRSSISQSMPPAYFAEDDFIDVPLTPDLERGQGLPNPNRFTPLSSVVSIVVTLSAEGQEVHQPNRARVPRMLGHIHRNLHWYSFGYTFILLIIVMYAAGFFSEEFRKIWCDQPCAPSASEAPSITPMYFGRLA